MKFLTYSDFKRSVLEYKLFEEMRVLNRVQLISLNSTICETAKESLNEITHSNRKASHIELYAKIQYVSFINCLLNLDIRESFDKLYNIISSYDWKIKNIQTVIGEVKSY